MQLLLKYVLGNKTSKHTWVLSGSLAGYWVFGSLDFGAPRWIIYDKEENVSDYFIIIEMPHFWTQRWVITCMSKEHIVVSLVYLGGETVEICLTLINGSNSRQHHYIDPYD
jgi:hypothetical protein